MCPRLEHEGLAVRVGSKGSPREALEHKQEKTGSPSLL